MRIALVTLLLVACGSKSTLTHRSHDSLELPITATAPGLGTVELERSVAIPIEASLAGLPHLAHLRTRITRDTATVTVELERGTDEFTARSSIMSRIQTAQLPEGVSPVLGRTDDHRGAILRYTLRGDSIAMADLTAWQDTTARIAVLRTVGVVDVETCGGAETRLLVDLDPEKLAATRLSFATVRDALSRSELGIGGSTTDFVVRGAARDPESIAHTKITDRVRLDEIARMQQAAVPATCRALDEHGEVVVGIVYARAGSESLVVRAAVEDALAHVQTPPGVVLSVLPRTKPIAFEVELDAAELEPIRRAFAQVRDVAHFVIGRETAEPSTWLRVVPSSTSDAHDVEARVLDVLHDHHVVVHGRDDIIVQILGDDPTQRQAIADAVAHELGTRVVGRIGDKRVDVRHFVTDRPMMARYSLAPADIADLIRAISEQGMAVTEYRVGEHVIPVVLRLPIDDPQRLPVPLADGSLIPLSAVAPLEIQQQNTEIVREDMRRWVGVRVAASEQTIRNALAHLAIPTGIALLLVAAD